MKRVLIAVMLVCVISFIAGCQVKWVKIDEAQLNSAKDVSTAISKEAREIADGLIKDINDVDKVSGNAPDANTQLNRVDVTLGAASAEISGTIAGIAKQFSAPYADKDAIVFDIAKEWNKKPKEIRGFVFFDNKPYSIAAVEGVKAEVAKLIEKNVSNFNVSSIPFLSEYTSGIVRGIGCDFEKKLLRLKLANDMAKGLPMYRNVLPRIKGALIVYLNGKLLELQCTDVIASGQVVDCIKADAQFVLAKQNNVLDESALFKLSDIVAISIPGRHEQFSFKCLPTG